MIVSTVGAGCAKIIETTGKVTGNVAGKTLAQSRPPPPAVVIVEPKGGSFCGVTQALGWPPQITDDKINRPLAGVLADTLDHGEKYCQWGVVR